jgi:hypothetical protein
MNNHRTVIRALLKDSVMKMTKEELVAHCGGVMPGAGAPAGNASVLQLAAGLRAILDAAAPV